MQIQASIECTIIYLMLSVNSRPISITTSSLIVVDADMSHLEALPYMCCMDISLLTFPFPGGLIVKLL